MDGGPADEGSARRQRPAGEALRRTLVCGQAVSQSASAGGRCQADSIPIQPAPPPPGLPPTREQQQQARRLAEAGAKEVERVKAALEPRKPPAETKPRARDPMKAWVRAGLSQWARNR